MLEFPIVRKNRRESHTLIKTLFIILFIGLFISIFLLDVGSWINGTLGILLFLLGILMNYLKEHIKDGEIIFEEDGSFIIKPNNVSAQVSYNLQSENIQLILSTYQQRIMFGTALNINEGSSGLGNFVEIIDESGTLSRYEFFIETKAQFKKLIEINSKN